MRGGLWVGFFVWGGERVVFGLDGDGAGGLRIWMRSSGGGSERGFFVRVLTFGLIGHGRIVRAVFARGFCFLNFSVVSAWDGRCIGILGLTYSYSLRRRQERYRKKQHW